MLQSVQITTNATQNYILNRADVEASLSTYELQLRLWGDAATVLA